MRDTIIAWGYYRWIITGLLLLILKISSYTQQGYLQFDKPYYFAGEHVFYQIYLQNVISDSTVIEMRLTLDDQDVTSHFHRIRAGHCSGYFKLSHEWEEGVYTIHAYAFELDNGHPLKIFTEGISVLNSGLKDPPVYALPVLSHKLTSPTDLEVDLKHEGGNTKARINFGNRSYRDATICIRQASRGEATLRSFRHHLHQIHTMPHLPIRGSRQLDHPDQNRSPLLYVTHPKTLQFSLTKVNQTGQFLFSFGDIYGVQELQFVEFFGLPMELSLSSLSTKDVPLYREISDTTIYANLQDYNEQKKIFQLFSTTAQTLLNDTVIPFQVSLPPDYDYDVQDFAIRGTIVDFIKEVNSPLKFRKKKDGYVSKMLYEVGDYKYYYSGPTLFIVNDVATHNVQFVTSLVLQEIKRIRIYSRTESLNQVVGGHRIGGVVIIDLMDPLFKVPDEFRLPGGTISGFQNPLIYPLTLSRDNDLPRIEPLVFWWPAVNIQGEGEIDIEFPTPDIKGDYQIDMFLSTGSEQFEFWQSSIDLN